MKRAAQLAAHYLRHRFRKLHPFEVQAVLLNECNLRCAYCSCPEMPVAQMSTEQWRQVIRSLGDVGTLRIKFQGGEPTLRRDFGEIAKAAKDAGMITAVITNGMAIPAKPSLLDHIDEVVVSLDGLSQSSHDKIRGRGSHAKALAALDIAHAQGRKTYINMVVHRTTYDELEPMLAFCESRGHRLNAQAVMFGAKYQNSEGEGLRLPEATERAMYRQLAEWARQGRALMFSSGSYDRSARWPDFTAHAMASPGRSSCMAGRFYLQIDPDGDVRPCGLHVGSFVAKNLVRDGFEPALTHARHHNCGDCSFAYLNERKAVFGFRPAALGHTLRRG